MISNRQCAAGAKGNAMTMTNMPQETATTPKTTSAARGWRWDLLAVGLGVGIGLAFATNTIPAPWSGLSKPWPRIITATLAGVAVADVIRLLVSRIARTRRNNGKPAV
jgi:hypothetical protein